MKQKAAPLKRYIYISQRKIGMFDSQRSYHWWQPLIKWIPHLTTIKLAGLELSMDSISLQDSLSQHQKMQRILAKIKRDNRIGTIAQPAAYIHDTLPLFQTMFPSEPTYHLLKGDTGFVYFGGGTESTSLGLIGAPRHLIGAAPDEPGIASSDLPILIEYANKRITEILPIQRSRLEDRGLNAIWYYDEYFKGSRIPMEFLAYRIDDSIQRNRKRVLLYTPIYVAYKD